VPAYVRRYPFMSAHTSPDEIAVCIDEACAAFGQGEGVPLFDAGGEPSPMLKQVINLLREYERQAQVTRTFVKRLEQAGLLTQTGVRVDLAGRTLSLNGFWIVDEARFRALPAGTLAEWFETGEIGLIHAHLLSIGNLLELLHRGVQADAPADARIDAPAGAPPHPYHGQAVTA
jgi:hypothetical protein